MRRRTAGDLKVVDRLFTTEAIALALARDDENFRLMVDRAVSRLFTTGKLASIYAEWFGPPDRDTEAFFRWSMLPE
jgi:ABC-type amino acid transport substrate-binding protein